MQIFKMEVKKPPRCPACGSSEIYEEDLVYAYSRVLSVSEDSIEFVGESYADWNTAHPASDPPGYECANCGAHLKRAGTEFEEEN